MGGVTSTFRNNAELVDNLISSRFITSETIERVFRAVDRGDFFPREERRNAYRDLAWNSENIHISSPCIYGQVMEHFNIFPGLSFLNLGSGTGYLNAVVGLLLGPHGVNHGIDINEYSIQYAYEKLDEFEETSTALDEYEFCRPKFVIGNCFSLCANFPQYDRVYCGAACPRLYENYMKNLLKVNGILIMVIGGVLTCYTRTSEDTWIVKNLRSIYFASFVPPGPEKVETLKNEPLSLQCLCRSTIRVTLQNTIKKELAVQIENARNNVKDPPRKKQRMLAPIGDGSYLETIDDRNETYLMTLLDEFRSDPIPIRPPSNIIEPIVFNELVRDESESVSQDDSMWVSDSSGENSNDDENPSCVHNESSLNMEIDQQSSVNTDAMIGSASTSNRNPIRTRRVYWQQASEMPVLTVPSEGPSYNQITNGTNEAPETNIVSVEETTTGNEELETTPNPNNNLENTTNGSEMIISPLVQSLARLGEPRDNTNIEMMPHELQANDVYRSPYTSFMRAKIQGLPLPPKLKRYINLNRDFD